ncbi:hypothetical protein KY285_016494 [Solanum tuberosum]|nr:hypothetical protein KY284_016495 [Solanum tuberosum]KAH0702216.1 hypothetical protein KY285_016494 [Solanum tuberosum]
MVNYTSTLLRGFYSLNTSRHFLNTLFIKSIILNLANLVIVLTGRKIVGGSCIGGMKETQEMLDFCAKHNITADIELISVDNINMAMERFAKSDVNYRFVIDIANSLSSS